MGWLRHKVPETPILNENDDFQLGELELGGIEIRCHYLTSSEWGVLANYREHKRIPTWILYTQLDMQQLGNNKLKYTKMSLDFESDPEQGDGVIVTKFYGPTHIRGPSETREITHQATLDPEVAVGPVTARLGTLGRTSTQERTERWHFDAMRKPGRVGDRRIRRVDWTITEARHASDPNHNPEWKLGVVLTHDGQPFKIHLNISISFILSNGIFKLQPKETTTPTEVVPLLKDPPELDTTAAQLPSVLLLKNLIPVPTGGQDCIIF